MFKLFKRKQEIPQQNILDKFGLFSVQVVTSLLNEPNCQAALQELKQLASFTQSNYQTLYLDLVYKFAEFVQWLPDKQNPAF